VLAATLVGLTPPHLGQGSLLAASAYYPAARAAVGHAALGEVRRGELVRLVITGTPKPGYYTYPITPPVTGMPKLKLSRLQFDDAEKNTFRPLPPVIEAPPPHEKKDSDGEVYFVHDRPFTWSQDLLVLPEATPGDHKLRVTVRL